MPLGAVVDRVVVDECEKLHAAALKTSAAHAADTNRIESFIITNP